MGEHDEAKGAEGTAADGGAPRREKPKLEQDVESAAHELGRLATGVVGHLFGAKAVGRAEGEVPSVAPEVDRAIDAVGDTIGKVLHAVGEGLAQHPVDPEQAVHTVGRTLREPGPPPKAPGWSGLTSGLGHLARGLGATAERVADELAGKKKPGATTTEPPPEPPVDAPAPAEGAAPDGGGEGTR
jgi:hypothetical protein